MQILWGRRYRIKDIELFVIYLFFVDLQYGRYLFDTSLYV